MRGFRPCKPPYGYKNVSGAGIKAYCEICEEEAKFVRLAYEKYSTGLYTLDLLLAELNTLGLKIKGQPISRSGLAKMLSNIFYIGKFIYNGVIYEGEHKAIISKDLFYRVKKLLNRGLPTSLPLKHDFTYSMMITCWYDGHYFVGYIKKGKYVYWKCYCRKGHKKCENQQISQIELEKQIESIFENLYIPLEDNLKIRKMLLQMHKEKCMFCDKTLEQINSEIEKIEKQSKLLTTKLLEGVIDDITYKEMKTEFSIKLDKLELEKDKIKEIPKSFSYYVENLLELCKDAPHLWKTAEPLKKRELLKIVCSNLQIKDRKLIVTLAPPFSQLSKIKINGQNLHSVHVSGQGWIRTTVVSRRQIYSLLPLATRAPTHIFCFQICL